MWSGGCFVIMFINAALSIDHQEELQRRKEMRRGISSSLQYAEDVVSGHAPYTLFGQWAGQRRTRHASQRRETEPSAFGVSFHKCAQVESGGSVSAQVQVRLQVSNPQQGGDLSQLCIRDSVSGVTLLQTNSSVQERGFQTFSADSLRAGSQYVVVYRMSVKVNRDQILNLPAYLTFSNATQNDIHLFGPVIANFTVRINTTEQVNKHRPTHTQAHTLMYPAAGLCSVCVFVFCVCVCVCGRLVWIALFFSWGLWSRFS